MLNDINNIWRYYLEHWRDKQIQQLHQEVCDSWSEDITLKSEKK